MPLHQIYLFILKISLLERSENAIIAGISFSICFSSKQIHPKQQKNVQLLWKKNKWTLR